MWDRPPMRCARAAAALLSALLLASLVSPHGGSARVAAHDRGVPILLYHVVNNPPAGDPYPGLYVRPTDFAKHMAWLARDDYRAITLHRAYDYWTRGVPLPRRPFVISLDDGYLSQYTRAFPVLESHH